MEEKVRSGEEYDEMAGVAGTDGEGEIDRTGGDDRSVLPTGCGSSMVGYSEIVLVAQSAQVSIGVECIVSPMTGIVLSATKE